VTSSAEAEEEYGAAGWLARAASDFLGQGGQTAVLVRSAGPEGLAALDAEDIHLLVVDPSVIDLATAYTWCEEHRALLVVDATPEGALPTGLSRNAAAYYPPLVDGDGTRPVAPAVAGVIARNDRTRRVWTSPAGRDAEVLGGRPAVALDSRTVESLANAHVNPLRDIGDGRLVVWGARTATTDPEWKYVAVRRSILFLEQSIDEGLRWAVFEPNDDALWLAARRAVEAFLLEVWRDGGLRGDKPEEAYFVRCDRSTMTQEDIDNGRLVVLVGVAPARPAEFVLFRIGQWTSSRPDPADD